MQRALRVGFAGAAALYIGVWAILAALRAGHPFEHEWLEGAMLAHVVEVRGAGTLYAEPSLDYVPFGYPPLYPLVVSLFGESLLALRAVSIACTSLVLVLVAWIVWRNTRSALGALGAAGMFAAGFRHAGAFTDLGRNDALMLALIAGCLALCTVRGNASVIVAGFLAALSVLAKQSGGVIALGLAAGLVLVDWRRSLRFCLATAGSFGVFWLVGWMIWGEWWKFYMLDVLSGQELNEPSIPGFWIDESPWLLPAFAAALVGARGVRPPIVGFVVGSVLASWMTLSSIGSYDNAMLPTVLALALAAGHAVGHLAHDASPRLGVALSLGLVQLGLFAYDPRAQLPRAEDRERGEALVAELAAVEGEVLIPAHPYLAARAGKGWSMHWMALLDLSATGDGKHGERLVQELEAQLAERRYAAVVLDEFEEMDGVRWFFERYLRLERRIVGPRTITGTEAQPTLWMVPRER